ncbi:MCE family protein [Spirillospora sp. CA-294931]|uniref:MCE family protein n=1 Tax=Spirillospora sp. CA-294931 TaxID=3240042 RepID=UPI003D8C546A
MNSRLTINLGVFAALAVVMVIWAFNNVIRFDFIDKPYNISVEFESSPGLHAGFEVDYLGLRIGKIDSVRLEKSKVVVKLDIDRGIKVPRGVHAAAARKSAVGEPVVELTPASGRATAPPMKPGETIPVSRTSIPPKYGDLFGAVIRSLKAIDPADAKVLTHELAQGWSGRENSLRQIINGSDQLSATFADNSALLDGLTKDLGRITRVLNQNRGELASGVDNLAALTAALRQVKGQLTELRDRGPDLLGTVNALLDKTGPDFECTVDTLAGLGISKSNPRYLQDLRDTLRIAPELKHVLDNVISQDQGRPILNVAFMLTLRTTAVEEYKYPLPQPRPNQVPNCPTGRSPEMPEQKPYQAKDPGATRPTHDPSLNERKAANQSPDDSSGPPTWLIYIPPVIALLVLVRVMAGSVPLLSRFRRKD